MHRALSMRSWIVPTESRFRRRPQLEHFFTISRGSGCISLHTIITQWSANEQMDKIFKEVSVKKLYKDCMFLAKYFGRRQGNEKVIMAQVRQQFKANMHEVDDDKIKEQKEAAIRALHNLHLLEADRYVRDKKT